MRSSSVVTRRAAQPTGRPREWTETALSVAAQHGQLVSVHALLRLGADPWHRVMWEGAPHRVDELVARCEGAELVREYLRLYGLRFQAFVSDATVDDILAGGGAVKIRARQLADVSRSLSLTRPHSRLGLTALHAAARVNDVPSITYLLTARVPVDVPDANGSSPLMTAIDFESFEAFEALRAAGASPAHVNARSLSVLRAAVVVGEMRMVRHLCDTDAFQRLTKAEIDALLETAARTEEEKPELGSAVDRGGVREGLRAMLRRLANELLNARTDAAIDAAHAGDKDRVFDAIDRMGVPILAKLTSERASGRTLLFAATEGGHADLIAGLLDRGALPTVAWTGAGGDNVLHVASQRGHAAVLRLLIEAIPEVDRAALVDRPNEVEGMTPLLLACAAGHVACVRLLLDSGAAPRQRSMSQGATTLMLAARSGSLPCVQLLLERAKDDAPALMEELDRDENQVLGYAVRNRSWDVVRFFLAKGCRCLHRNRAGASILELARDSAHPDIVPSILQARNREYDALAEKALREVRALVTRRRALPNAPGLADDPASVVAVDAFARLLGEFPEVFVLAEPILAEARSLLFECDATEYSHNRVYKRAVELVLAGYKLFELELRHNEFVRACEERGDGGTHKLRQIEFLLSQPGVQLDGPRRRDGTTPLLAAIRGGAVLVAETLLRRGASADTACPFDGTTPLMRAASLARLEVIDLLLSAGARLELRDFEGKSALDWAADDETRTFLTRARRDERSALVRAD